MSNKHPFNYVQRKKDSSLPSSTTPRPRYPQTHQTHQTEQTHIQLLAKSEPHQSNISTGNPRRPRQRTVRQNRAPLFNIKNLRTRHAHRRPALHRRRTRESHRAKVCKRHLRPPRVKVLDDPLGVVLAERTQAGLVAERVRDALASGVVGDLGRAAGFATRGHGHGDGVPGREADAAEVVRVVRVPFVPCVVSDRGAGSGPVDAGLEDCGAAGVAVDSDPGLNLR